MANFINLTVTIGNGPTFSQLFDPSKMEKIRVNGAGTAISFLYEGEGYESTSFTSVASLQTAINLAAPSGTQTYIGILDASAGSSIGAHDLLDVNGNSLVLPDNTRVWDAYYEVVTTFTSATDAGTISLGVATDDVAGIKAAVAISTGTTYDAAAPKALIQDGTITNVGEKTTGSRAVQFTVAIEALTAGKMYVFLECITTPS